MEANYIIEVEYSAYGVICRRALVGNVRCWYCANQRDETGIRLDYEVEGKVHHEFIPHWAIKGIANFNNSRQVPHAPTPT